MEKLIYTSARSIWQIINIQQAKHDYPFVASTPNVGDGDGASAGTKLSKCGLAGGFSFPILSTFTLKNPEGKDMYYLYMIRDPNRIDELIEPKIQWHVKDYKSWTKEYREQVPYGIDPTDYEFFKRTGVFFVGINDFKKCFSDFA